METNPNADADDELRCLLHQIADKWTVLIIELLEPGPQRFTVLRRGLGDVTQKMLTQSLRGLERNGLVGRTVFAQVPPRVEYALTPLGRTLCEPLAAIRNWTEAHREETQAARIAYEAGASKEMI
jgi:DNA-binding HxlR family transcriptional regulator